jgi:hypothetical protein
VTNGLALQMSMDLECDIVDFLDTEASILYSKGFSTIPRVISAFAKREDITVADCGIMLLFRGLASFAFYCSLVRA